MSQAVIDFCDALKTTLLGVEDRLEKARGELEEDAVQAREAARRHIDEAREQLDAFKAQAANMAQSLRADLPEKVKPLQDKLQAFGQEAELAMRHAVVFLAEATAKGAGGASVALKAGAQRAAALAEGLKHETAVTVVEKPPGA